MTLSRIKDRFSILSSIQKPVTSIQHLTNKQSTILKVMIMVFNQKLSTPSSFTLLQQKGLFIFSILILVFLGFHFWEITQKSILSQNIMTKPGIMIELEGKIHRPGLLTYAKPPLVQQVIQDGGGFVTDQVISTSEGKEVLDQEMALVVEAERNGKILIHQKPLSIKALWILGRPIPLNRATAEDLDRLPGIGPGTAKRIVEHRQARGSFSSLGQLMEVKGIKDKTFEKLKGYLTL